MTVLRAELVKLFAQVRVRLLVLVCLLGPVLVALVLGQQSGGEGRVGDQRTLAATSGRIDAEIA